MRPPLVLLAALLLAAAATTVDAVYSCDAATCLAPDCECASTSPPGGIAPQDMPIFVLITHDDAVNMLQDRVVRTVTDGYTNPNGCNVPATWFTIKTKTNCSYVQNLIKDNHEIAGHTVNHAYMYANLTVDAMKAEVDGIKQYLVDECKVPADKLRGFRAPYLVHNQQFRTVLQSAGFQYDSSIMEATNTESSPSWQQRTFPYTMDAGIPQDCAWPGDPEMSCALGEKHPGLWEVPVWMLPSLTQDNGFTMDPKAKSAEELFQLLKNAFDTAYDGNKAPMPIFLHAPWFTYDNTEGFLEFMNYATAKNNTWFVTLSQLIDWMENPVPASQVGSKLTCNMVKLTPPKVEWCRKYKAGPVEDIWTVEAKFGISTDEALMAVSGDIISNKQTGSNQYDIPEGTVINLPPWDDRCDKPGVAFFPPVNDWYKPVYTQSQPVKGPTPAPSTTTTATATAAAPAPAVGTVVTAAAAPGPAVAAAPAAAVVVAPSTPEVVIVPGVITAPTPLDIRSAAASTTSGMITLLLAAIAGMCLLV